MTTVSFGGGRYFGTLLWRHNEHDSVSNHQPRGCLLDRLFRRRSKKTSKLRVTGLCVGNSPGPVNSPHKGPVTRKMFPFDDVIMTMCTSPPKSMHVRVLIDIPRTMPCWQGSCPTSFSSAWSLASYMCQAKEYADLTSLRHIPGNIECSISIML